jgi:hypothetical protein
VIEGWRSYDLFEELIEIEEFSQFSDASENLYELVLLAVNGSNSDLT